MVQNLTNPAADNELRHLSILAQLRQRIVEGGWPAGHRLPTRDELSAEFNASKITVQRAVEALIEDGLVVARGRAGTFVATSLPHLHTYGLVFASPRQEECWQWSPYYNGLVHQAAVLSQMDPGSSPRSNGRIKVYYGVSDPWADTAPEGLAADLRQRRLSGLIVVRSNLGWNPSQPVDVPVVSLGGVDDPSQFPAAVDMPWRPWCVRAVEFLVKSRVKRVALLNNAVRHVSEIDALAQLAASKGLIIKPQWIQGIFPNYPDWARRSVHLLVDRNSKDKPDALLITDDSLIAPASAGLVDAAVRVPRDLKVVAWSNLPSTVPGILPIVRVGFDLRLMLHMALEQIERMKMGRKVERVRSVPVMLEEEFLASQSSSVAAMSIH